MDNISSPEIKFDSYAEELLEKIKNEHIAIPPAVWELLSHVLGNRIYALNLTLNDFLDNPKWILKVGSYFMMFLYKISGGRGNFYTIPYYLDRALHNAEQMKVFLDRLREATKEKSGF